MLKQENSRQNLQCSDLKMVMTIKSRKVLALERDQLLKAAKSAEESWNIQEAISNYHLAANISKDVGEFEKARQLLEKIAELKRQSQLVKTKSLMNKKIQVNETKVIDLNKIAEEALEIAIIAEEEHRWTDAIEAYRIVVQKNSEMGDLEKAKAFEEKIFFLKQALESEK